jgi:hypothetical protein
MLLEPQEVTINDKTYILSKFPAIDGREIIAGYPMTGIPKIGEYKANEQIMFKLMSYVAVNTPNGQIRLSTRDLINNHVPDWEVLMKIEGMMLENNCSFFRDGRASTFFDGIVQKAPAWITKILTGLLAQSSPTEKPPSTN